MAPRPAGITVVPPAYYFPSPALEIETDNGFSPVAVSIAETASPTSIMSAAIGPGRTLDKLVTFLGRRLVTFLSVVSESHLGLGPNNLVGRMISSIDWSVPHCRYEVCPNYRSPTGKPPRVGLGKIPPSVKDVVELLSSPFCHACLDAHAGSLAGSKVFIAGCDKLVKELRRSNSSTRLLTAYYVCSLASFHERTRQVLVDINAMETFDFLVDELKLSLDHVLVAPSRRALFSIVESAIIPVIKEFDALEGRFDVYNHWHVPESEMASLLPHSVRSLSILVRGLQEPQFQIVAASRLSKSVVWQELCLASIFPGLRDSVNPEVVRFLWELLASTRDPVVAGTVAGLMASLYDFGAKSSFNQWDITGDRHTRSSEWAWNTLWVPLFHLRLYSPWMLVQVPHKLLQDICDGFFRWPLLAVAMSVQARDSIRALRQLMSESRVVTPGAPAEKEDCVLALMLEATSELLEIGGTMREEQLITVNYGGYDIPRYVPLSRTKVMCEEVIGVIMREDTTESIATSPSVLHTIAPYYGTVCQRELQALALPYRRSTDAFHRPRADALLRHLSMDVPPKRLCCIGVVAGTPDSGPSGVFLDHYRGPWAAGRTYDSSKPFMILVAEDSYCNLRWVAVSDMGEAGYDPIVVPAVWGGRPLYITRARARLLEKGRLSVVAPEDVRGEMESDVHVLCGDMICCPAFWMTRTTLVHAVTGHEQANELVLGDVFRAVSQLRCPCERTWAKYYGD